MLKAGRCPWEDTLLSRMCTLKRMGCFVTDIKAG